jgi:hypothetical protein
MNHRTLSLAALLFLPSVAIADTDMDLVDADFEDTIEDFTADRSIRDSAERKATVEFDSMDEDPAWDIPEEDDLTIDEDPSWDTEAEIGAGLDDSYEEEDDFIIAQTAPEPVLEEIAVDVELAALPETQDTGIQNADPGLDLSIFDIED